MSDNLEEVRRDIEVTRRALGEKIERLEDRIESTKKTILNPAYHVQKRPWPTLGTVAFLGWVVGRSLKRKPKRRRQSQESSDGLVRGILRGLALGAGGGVARIAGDWVHDFVKKQNRHER